MPPKPKKGGKAPEERKEPEKLRACNHVKARHILCEKQSKILQAYTTLKDQFGDTPPSNEFAKVATEMSECSSAKRGGDLGWFPRGKMVGDFQEVAFNLPPGKMSDPFRSREGYHIVLVEGRKA
eukprot:GILK01005927.1.p1 GENE.GILK01005927.1~~GILK01005927.1.p1  ORF type:complete len:138 (-),score=19.51 GILK01005927.1:193-564(-)